MFLELSRNHILTELRNFQGHRILNGDTGSFWNEYIKGAAKWTKDVNTLVKFQASISNGFKWVAITKIFYDRGNNSLTISRWGLYILKCLKKSFYVHEQVFFLYTTQKKKQKWKLIKIHIFECSSPLTFMIIEKSLRVVSFLYVKSLWYFWFFA